MGPKKRRHSTMTDIESLATLLSDEDEAVVSKTVQSILDDKGTLPQLMRSAREDADGALSLASLSCIEQLAFRDDGRAAVVHHLSDLPLPAMLAASTSMDHAAALARVCGNLAIDASAAARLCREGAVRSLVGSLAEASGARGLVDTLAWAVDTFGTTAESYEYIAATVRSTPGALAALAEATAGGGAEEEEEEEEEGEAGEGDRSASLLHTLVLGGHISPSAFLQTPGAVAPMLRCLDAPPESDSGHLAKVLLWGWLSEGEGLAVLHCPPPGAEAAAACAAAHLAKVSRRAAGALRGKSAALVDALLDADAGEDAAEAIASFADCLPPGALLTPSGVKGPAAKRRRKASSSVSIADGAERLLEAAQDPGDELHGALCGQLDRAVAAVQGQDFAAALPLGYEPRSEQCYALASARRGRGEHLFKRTSTCGQGLVRVTRYGPWLRLRFDDSEQGLGWVGWPSADDWRGGGVVPSVLGYDYIRSMAAAMAGFMSREAATGSVQCIGLGSGALPAWAAHHFPTARVVAVEIDAAVIAAAQDVFRHNFSIRGASRAPSPVGGHSGDSEEGHFEVVEGDALQYLEQASNRGTADVLLVDAYGRDGTVPPHLTEPRFLRACAAALNAGGTVIAQLPNGPPRSAERQRAGHYARALAEAIDGAVNFVRIDRQQSNVVLAAVKQPVDRPLHAAAVAERARSLGAMTGFDFDAASMLECVLPMRTGCSSELAVPEEVWASVTAKP